MSTSLKPSVTPPPPPPQSNGGLGLAAVDPAWAWAAYKPSPAHPWDAALAAHLYRRVGFGATHTELYRAVQRGPQATLEELLEPPGGLAAFNAMQEARELAAARSGESQRFEAWWLRRLIESPYPLGEKLTLFWHDHFAIGAAATSDLQLFHQHLQRLRAGALGEVRLLLGDLLNDPAMYIALGGGQNRRAQPNLSFARTWLEVFTVGPDALGPQDVLGAARALTGWFVYGDRLRFIPREHDEGTWTLLGRNGTLSRQDLLEALATHPATALHLARKLFRWFLSEATLPGEALLRPLAESLRRPGGLHATLGMIVRSNLFFSRHALRQKIKSPVELAVGLARGLQGIPSCPELARDLDQLGQRLTEPPTVHGWPAGADWINTMTLAARLRLGRNLLAGAGNYGTGLDSWATAVAGGCKTAAEAAQLWLEVLDLPPAAAAPILAAARKAPPGSAASRRIVTSLIAQPEFQLN